MENWLTSTIWGLLIIGTVGSIVAIILIRIFKHLFLKIIPVRLNNWWNKQIKNKATNFANELTDTLKEGGEYGFITYMIYHATSLIVFSILASTTFICGIVIFVNGVFIEASFLFIIFSFVFIYISLWKFLLLDSIVGYKGILASIKEFIKLKHSE